METDPIQRSARLNPFVFPSNTDFQFVLLILALTGAVIFVYNELYLSYKNNRDNRNLIHEQCLNITEPNHALDDFEKTYTRQIGYIHCVAESERARLGWIFAGFSSIFVTAFLIYLWLPKWKILYEHLEPLGSDNLPEIAEYVSSLCNEIGIVRKPTLLWNPMKFSTSGVAFGRLGQYYISLPAGLVYQFYNPVTLPRFRAIVLHELAHLQNADIDKTHFTVAIWWSFAINTGIALPVILLSESAGLILGLIWRAFVLILIVYLIRNALLRSREHYADVRVGMWDKDIETLESIFKTLPSDSNIFRILRRSHPDPADRLKVLTEPHRLLRNFGGWEFFGIGIIVSSIFFNAFFPILIPGMDVISNALSPTAFALLSSNLVSFGLALIFIPAAVGVMGISIWRALFVMSVQNRKFTGIGRLGIFFGLGIFVGKQLSFFFYDQKTTPGTLSGASLFTLETLWGILVIITMFLFFHWLVAASSVWVDVVAASKSPRRIYFIVGQTMIALLLTLWLVQLFNLYILLSEGDLLPVAGQITGISIPENLLFLFLIIIVLASIIINPLTLLSLAIIWLFPLTAWFWQRKINALSKPEWAYLEPSLTTEMIQPQETLQPATALKTGLIVGLALLGISMVYIFLWRFVPANEIKLKYEELSFAVFMTGMLLLSIISQVGVAGVAGFRMKQLGWAHGLFSAFIVCFFAAVGVMLYFSFTDEGISLQSSWIMFIILYYITAPFVISTAIGASALSQRFHANKAGP